MSTLTKVFVVLLAVFSIAFTTMTVSIVARTEDWRANSLNFESRARIADAALRNQIAAHSAEIASLRDTIKAKDEELGRRDSDLKKITADLAQLQASLAQANTDKASQEAMNRSLTALLQSGDARIAEHLRQRDDLEKRAIDLERRNIDLDDRVNEQTANLAVLVEQRRHFEQQINLLQQQIDSCNSKSSVTTSSAALESPRGTALPNVSALAPVARSAIRGKIKEISGNLVTITVGSADGVKQDMVFVIHRGNEYVGDVRITVVSPNESAGKLESTRVAPQIDDQVTDMQGLGQAARR